MHLKNYLQTWYAFIKNIYRLGMHLKKIIYRLGMHLKNYLQTWYAIKNIIYRLGMQLKKLFTDLACN